MLEFQSPFAQERALIPIVIVQSEMIEEMIEEGREDEDRSERKRITEFLGEGRTFIQTTHPQLHGLHDYICLPTINN